MSRRRGPRLSGLSRERYAEAWEVVRIVLPLEGASRETALAEVASRDAELAELARHVLEEAASPASGHVARVLGSAAAALVEQAALVSPGSVPTLPRRFGQYVLLREIGRGGMGTIYEADQESAGRRVALKLLRADFTGKEHERRFRHEARLLGQLQHPGIAQVHEGGFASFEDGREIPYIAMELVDGMQLLDFARERRLGVAARLDLLARACDAVQHAHDRGIVHRDLKPANILVDGGGHPKILDFGVARTLDAALAPTTLLTQSGHVLGTIAYMSPEQASGRGSEADARSDVYSLGVVGYELLAGRRPHDTGGLDWPRALHAICVEEPTALGSLDSSLAGDIETIIGKALEKSPERRYQSAADLADDIRRHLASEPIRARSPSVSYRAQRFVRRHRSLVVGLAALFLILAASSIVSMKLALDERAARRDAVAAVEIARRHEAEARREHGLASLALADSALRDGDAGVARRHLERVAAPDRGWPWRHLATRLDESSTMIPGAHPGIDQAAGFIDSGRLLAVVTRDAVSMYDVEARQRTWTRSLPDARMIFSVPIEGRILLEDDAGQFLLDLPTWTRHPLDAGDAPTAPLQAQAVIPRLRGEVMEHALVDFARARTVAVARGDAGEIARTDSQSIRRPPIPLLSRKHQLLVTSSALPGVAGMTWDAATGRRLHRLPGPAGRIDIFALSPDGRHIVGGGADGLLLKWDAATGRPSPWEPPELKGHVDGLLFMADGATVVVDQINDSPCALDSSSGRLLWCMDDSNRAWASVPSHGPAGTLLVPVSRGAVKLVEVANGHEIARLVGHSEQVRAHLVTPDGSTIITIDHEGELRFWNAEGPNRAWRHDSYVYGVSVAPDGRRVASGGWDGTVRTWDLVTGEALQRLQAPGSKGQHGVVAWSPDGRWLASSHDCRVVLWDAASLEVVDDLDLSAAPKSCAITRLAWDATGHRLAVARESGRLSVMEVIETDTGGALTATEWAIESHAVAISPADGRLAAVVEREQGWSIEEWEAAPPRLRRVLFETTGDGVTHLAYSVDGSLLAAAGRDGSVGIIDMQGGGLVANPAGHVGIAWCVAFHPDGTLLASGGDDDVIRLWDVSSGAQVLELRGHSDYVYRLAWCPDGSTLVSASGDGSVRPWRAAPSRGPASGPGEGAGGGAIRSRLP